MTVARSEISRQSQSFNHCPVLSARSRSNELFVRSSGLMPDSLSHLFVFRSSLLVMQLFSCHLMKPLENWVFFRFHFPQLNMLEDLSMRLLELCSQDDKIQLYKLLMAKTRTALGLDDVDVADLARQSDGTRPQSKSTGVVLAKGPVVAKKKAVKGAARKFSSKPQIDLSKIPGQAPQAGRPGQQPAIASNQPERGVFRVKNTAGKDRWLYQPSTLSKYPGRQIDRFNSLSP